MSSPKTLQHLLHLATYTIWIVSILLVLNSNTQAENKYLVTDIRPKDGDTYICNIHLDFDIVLKDQVIRCADYDAWEISNKRKNIIYDPEEYAKGIKAKTDLINYVAKANVVEITINSKRLRDTYGRILAITYVDGKLLRDYMYLEKDLRPSRYNAENAIREVRK